MEREPSSHFFCVRGVSHQRLYVMMLIALEAQIEDYGAMPVDDNACHLVHVPPESRRRRNGRGIIEVELSHRTRRS